MTPSDKEKLNILTIDVAVIKTKQETMGDDISEMKGDIKTLLVKKTFKFPIKISIAGVVLGVIGLWKHLY